MVRVLERNGIDCLLVMVLELALHFKYLHRHFTGYGELVICIRTPDVNSIPEGFP